MIFSSQDESDTIRRLLGDDVQAFVDVMDEARSMSIRYREPVLIKTDIDMFYYQALDRPDLSPRTRENCLRSLCKICGRHALLPTTLKTPISVERTGDVMFRGGFADVWKGDHCGRDVAVKVMRIYSESELQRVIGVSYWLCSLFPCARVLTLPRQRFCKEVVVWKALQHPNVLPLIGVTMSETRFAMISDWMANGNITSFVKAHPDANRLELVGPLFTASSSSLQIH